MKVRDYLHLVKWLDNEPMHGRHEIERFILRLNLNALHKDFIVSGNWKDCVSGNEIGTINIKPEYLYLLEFSVMKDQWHTDSWSMEDNKPVALNSCILLDIVPQNFLSGDIRIPQELMQNIVMDAYHTGESDTCKRNSKSWFGF